MESNTSIWKKKMHIDSLKTSSNTTNRWFKIWLTLKSMTDIDLLLTPHKTKFHLSHVQSHQQLGNSSKEAEMKGEHISRHHFS